MKTPFLLSFSLQLCHRHGLQFPSSCFLIVLLCIFCFQTFCFHFFLDAMMHFWVFQYASLLQPSNLVVLSQNFRHSYLGTTNSFFSQHFLLFYLLEVSKSSLFFQMTFLDVTVYIILLHPVHHMSCE